jgi:enamine deaminase RidA (YjgF/YER057c/UK114 family)
MRSRAWDLPRKITIFLKGTIIMEKKSRRGLLRNSATAVAAAAAGATLLGKAAQAQPALEKRSPFPPNPTTGRPMYSGAVAYGNMLFMSGVGYHKPGTIEDHTRGVLDEIKKNLENAGSSLQKCLKVTVFLADLKDYDAMNAVYRTYDWGSPPPVRTTTAAAGVPGNSLIEIDVIAYI